MKRRIFSLLLCTAMLSGAACGCGNEKDEMTEQGDSSMVVREKVTFDIEDVRKNITIKGYEFTVPQKLSELDNGLTYAFVDEEFGDGLYEVEISDSSGVILCSIAENAHKKSGKASLYNIAINDSDSNVLGITPQVSNKEDVLKIFGEPDETKETDLINKKIFAFIYGSQEETDGYRTKGQFMNIAFNEDDIVESIVINYVK